MRNLSKATVVKRIAATRKRGGITTTVAASKAGIAQSSWSEVETGKRFASWDQVIAMAKAVGLNIKVVIE